MYMHVYFSCVGQPLDKYCGMLPLHPTWQGVGCHCSYTGANNENPTSAVGFSWLQS